MTTDAPRSDSPPDLVPLSQAPYAWIVGQLMPGNTADEILGKVPPEHRPAVARYLVQQGEALRSEFRSETEAEAFWAHVGEDTAIEHSNLGEHGMAQVPDPCCCRVHAGAGNRCPDCPQHSGE